MSAPLPKRPPAGSPSRAWLLRLAGAGAGLLAVLMAAAIYLASKLPKRAEASGPPPAAAREDVPLVGNVRPGGPTDRASPEAKAEAAAGGAERVMEALGGLTGAHIYQSFLSIGLLADAAERDAYSEEDAARMLDTIATLLDTVDQQLAGLAAAGLRPEDAKALQRSREVIVLLRSQIRVLRAYWQTGEAEAAANFQTAREATWAGLKELLGISE